MAKEQKLDSVHYLTRDLHVWPDLHGNRSPLADSTIKGMICGLTMTSTVENLAITYLAFVQALSVSFTVPKSIQVSNIHILKYFVLFTVWNETYFRSTERKRSKTI